MAEDLSFKTQILISLSLESLTKKKKGLPLPYWFLNSCFPGKRTDEIFNTVWKLENDGCLLKSYIGRTKYLSLSDAGMEKMWKSIKYIHFLREKWDGKFRMVLFDIPESDRKIRDQFRNMLVELGCVSWQKSVFITCHLVEEKLLKEVKKLGIQNEVNAVVVDGPIGDREKWVWDLWKLEPINNDYNLFISRANSLLAGKIGNFKDWVLECQEVRFSYYTLICKEPFLPYELIGEKYLFNQVEESYELLGKKLVRVLERA